MSLIGELVVKITGNTAALDRSIDKTEAKLKKLSQSAVQLGKQLTLGLTLPIVALGVAFVKAASSAEETQSKFNVVFRDQAEEVNRWAETFSKAVGRGVTENKRFLAGVQDLFVPLGFAREEATKMSKSVVQLATDLGSFNDVPTADVVRDIQGGLVGMHIAVRKYGILLNEATISQELLNMGLVGGFKAATDMQKVQARLNLIMKGSADAAGDAERTIESFANQMRALQGDVMDLTESLGAILIPVLKDIITEIRKWIVAFNELDDRTKGIILTVAALAAAIGPVLFILGSLSKSILSIIGLIRLLKVAMAQAAIGAAGFAAVLAGPLLAALVVLAGIPLLIGLIAEATRDHTAANKQAIAFQKEINEEFVVYREEIRKTAEEINKLQLTEITRQIGELNAIILRYQRRIESLGKRSEEAMTLQTKLFKLQADRFALLERFARIQGELADAERKDDEDKLELKTRTFEASEQMITDHLSFESSYQAARAALATETEEKIREEDKKTADAKKAAAEKTAQLEHNLLIDRLATTASVAASIGQIWANHFAGQLANEKLSSDERKKFQQDAAIAAKAFGVFQTGINTAIAITNALATVPWPFSIPAAALAGIRGAAQLAAVLSTPIPKLAKGGVALGPSIVGEAGPELALPLTDEIFSRLANAIENAKAPDIVNQITPSDSRPIDLKVGVSIGGKQLNAFITTESRNGRIIIDKTRGISK